MKNKPRTLIIGLDGVPYSLLLELRMLGCIPNMAQIFQQGCLNRMAVCIPEISSVSWSSFMTGDQAGRHGIYGFMDLAPGTYNLYFPNFAHLRTTALWDDLAGLEKTSVVVNMPATYPARAMPGALISGFVAIDLNKAVYPSSLAPLLRRMDYRIDIDARAGSRDHDALFRDLEDTLAGRRRAVDYLWDDVDWDLFIVVVTGTDRLMHFLWHAYENRSHRLHGAFLDYFRKVDGFVGALYERFSALNGSKEGMNSFYMLSDHGFTGIRSEVSLNTWLVENGFLQFQSRQPKTIMDIGAGSQAFALDPSRIYINMKDKYPLGCVDGGDYDRIRSDLIQGLQGLRFTDGAPVIKRVYTKEELYFGDALAHAPDLVALSNHGFDLKGKVGGHDLFGRSNLTGMHTQDDAFFFSSSGQACPTIFKARKMIVDGFASRLDDAATGR